MQELPLPQILQQSRYKFGTHCYGDMAGDVAIALAGDLRAVPERLIPRCACVADGGIYGLIGP